MKGSLVKLFMTYPGYLYTLVLCTVLATMCTPTLLLWFTRHNIVTNVAAYCDGDYIFRDYPTESRTPHGTPAVHRPCHKSATTTDCILEGCVRKKQTQLSSLIPRHWTVLFN